MSFPTWYDACQALPVWSESTAPILLSAAFCALLLKATTQFVQFLWVLQAGGQLWFPISHPRPRFVSIVTPSELDKELAAHSLRPVYIIVGDETFLCEQALRSIKAECLAGGSADFNADTFQASETTVDRVINAARTVPMLAPRRFISVRSVERWDSKSDGSSDSSSSKSPADRLAEYLSSPVPSACLVLCATKLDQRRKWVAQAKKEGCIVQCEHLDDAALTRWIVRKVKSLGCTIPNDVADQLAKLVGPQLAIINDAVNRLTLYVGKQGQITDEVVSDLIVKVRESSVFELVNAIGRRQTSHALRVLDDVYDPKDRGLPLVGLLAWSVRQLLRFEAAIRQGSSPEEAAKQAGAKPFRAKELLAQTKQLPRKQLERWLLLLAEADLALKGSRRHPKAVLETLLLAMANSRLIAFAFPIQLATVPTSTHALSV
jgi:DNA polymerase III subunit delta